MTSAPLLALIQKCDLSSVAIFSGATVDPDGLASSLAMKRIIEHLGGRATCFYRGSFNRPQNKTMREVLSLIINSDETATAPDSKWSLVIIVDGPSDTCPLDADFIIDHHKQSNPAKLGNDVRQTGSCSAILWEYAYEVGLFRNEGDERCKTLATALAIGILTDTNNFKDDNATPQDFAAVTHCLQRKDHKAFLSIVNWPKPAYYNDLYALGWNNKVQEGTVLVTGLGDIPEGRSGVISDLAEKFGETHGITTSVVVAMVASEIVMSVRSSNNSLDVNDFVKSVFGNGGGKRGAGAARIPLPEHLMANVSDTDRSALFNIFLSIIVKKTLAFAGDGAHNDANPTARLSAVDKA